jgi:hypothetical protein
MIPHPSEAHLHAAPLAQPAGDVAQPLPAPARQGNLFEGEVPAHRHAHRRQPLRFRWQPRLLAQLFQFPSQLRFSKSKSFYQTSQLPFLVLFFY